MLLALLLKLMIQYCREGLFCKIRRITHKRAWEGEGKLYRETAWDVTLAIFKW